MLGSCAEVVYNTLCSLQEEVVYAGFDGEVPTAGEQHAGTCITLICRSKEVSFQVHDAD